MAGDYTRFTFDPRKRYSGVRMQQGRVQVDADWNEAIDIVNRRLRTLSLDAFGPVGLPFRTTPDAFLVGTIAGPPADLSLGAGRLYVRGCAAEIFPDEGCTYLTQPFLPDPPSLPEGDAIVYLDVWEREITSVEDPTIADVALGGADTATRTQIVWQVRVEARDGARCGLDVGEPPSAGRLTTAAFAPPAPDDPCLLPPQSGYRGLENRLYRVEIHDGGPLGTARFKWSRDNGSIVSAVRSISVAGAETTIEVTRIGRDQTIRFRIDDWVTVTDDHRELHGEPGEMARVVDIDEARSLITLDRALPAPGQRAFGGTAADVVARHTRVQRWDQTPATNTLDGDGLVATGPGPIDLEHGVQVSFSADPAGGSFRTGDYWVFAARTADASVETLTAAPPRGIRHHYAQLAAITGLAGAEPDVADCRPRPEERGERCCCCLVSVGARPDDRADFTTLAGAVAALPNLAPDPAVPVIVCLLDGDHAVHAPVRLTRPNVTVRGCGWGTRLVAGRGNTILELVADNVAVESLAMLAEHQSPLVLASGTRKRLAWCRLENQGSGPALAARKVTDLLVERNLVLASGGLDLAGTAVEVADNRVLGGTIRVRSPSDTVRIRGNDLIGAAEHGITVGDRGVVYDVQILDNRIRRARRNGIASGEFDPEHQGRDGIVDGLVVAGNEIVECVAADAERGRADPPFGGIVLARVYDLLVRDNRIERNGEETLAAVCGIHVRHSRGLEVSRNVIRENGRRPDRGRISGAQAGISLLDAGVALAAVADPAGAEVRVAEVGILPAARIADNLVESRRGPALYIRGQGPMTIDGNRFQAFDILGDFSDFTFATVDQYIGTVFAFNAGLPGYFAAYLAGAGVPATGPAAPRAVSGTPLLTGLTVGGQTQYRGNQARLDLARLEGDLVFANVAIVSLDDAVMAGNQTEGVLLARVAGGDPIGALAARIQPDLMLADLLTFALTTRQTHNGLMSTPLLTMFSILSFGMVNHCVDNQTTSCIRAAGASPKSVVRDNAVIFPHPAFCREG